MDLIANLLKNVDIDDIAGKFGFDTEEVKKIVGALGSNEEVKKVIPDIASQATQAQASEQTAGAQANTEQGGMDLTSMLSGLNLESVFSSLSKETGIDKEKLNNGGTGLIGAVLSKLTGAQGGGLLSLLNADSLTAMLDKDGDGKITDDLLDAAKKLF